jgi:hypothetical protein
VIALPPRPFISVHDDWSSGPSVPPSDPAPRVALRYAQRSSKARASAATRKSEPYGLALGGGVNKPQLIAGGFPFPSVLLI